MIFSYKMMGCKRDARDNRDYLWQAPRIIGATLPSQIDLSGKFPKVYNQGNLGSCTAQAIASVLDVIHSNSNNGEFFSPSRLFIYYFERELEGTIEEDSGASLRDGIKVSVKKGVCPESYHPYDIEKFTEAPSKEAENEALKYQVLTYHRIAPRILYNSVDEIRATLAAGFPVVCGIQIFESFMNDITSKSGYVSIPDMTKEEILGGHAVVLVGYDDSSNEFKMRNSWGEEWGMNGYCKIPYNYIKDKMLAADFWVIKKAE